MNKNDAKVYKALAECGFEFGHDIPDPSKDRDHMIDYLYKLALDDKEIYLEKVEILFADNPEEIVTISKQINELLENS